MSTTNLSRGRPPLGVRMPARSWRTAGLVITTVALLSMPGYAQPDRVTADPPPMPETRFLMEPPGMHVADYVTGLECVWEIVFLPDDRMLLTERPGRIRLVTVEGELRDEPWAAPQNVFHSGGGGMMGLALHPRFADEPWVYAMYTLATDAGPVNRVVRYRDAGEHATDKQVILDDLPAANTHNGGRIAFGPDGMLYVCIGDTGRAPQSQEIDDLRGSILRVTPEGEIPDDNPWPDSPLWAIGLRNVQGLAFHLDTGALFAADHGPRHHDQLHVIQGGKNYGWPWIFGAAGVEGYEDPLLEWIPAAPPGSLAFYTHDLLADLQGDLLFTTLRSRALIRIRFQDNDDLHRPTAKERWFVPRLEAGRGESAFGRLRAIAVGPDGALYIGTSNIDRGRGTVRDGDDRIIRIVPTGAQ